MEVVYQQGLAGTGQPFVEYPQLDLEFYALFALGSPIGMFLTVRWERSSTVGNLRGSSHYSLFRAAGRTILRLRKDLRRVGERFAAGLVLIIISARPLADLSPARVPQGIIPSRRLSSCRSADNEGLLQGYRRLFQLLSPRLFKINFISVSRGIVHPRKSSRHPLLFSQREILLVFIDTRDRQQCKFISPTDLSRKNEANEYQRLCTKLWLL